MLKLYELTVYDANDGAVFFEIFTDRGEAENQAKFVREGYRAVIEIVEIADVYDTDAECFTVVLSSGTVLGSLSDYSPDGYHYNDVPEDCFNNRDYVADLLEQVRFQDSAVHSSGLDMFDIYDEFEKYFEI